MFCFTVCLTNLVKRQLSRSTLNNVIDGLAVVLLAIIALLLAVCE